MMARTLRVLGRSFGTGLVLCGGWTQVGWAQGPWGEPGCCGQEAAFAPQVGDADPMLADPYFAEPMMGPMVDPVLGYGPQPMWVNRWGKPKSHPPLFAPKPHKEPKAWKFWKHGPMPMHGYAPMPMDPMPMGSYGWDQPMLGDVYSDNEAFYAPEMTPGCCGEEFTPGMPSGQISPPTDDFQARPTPLPEADPNRIQAKPIGPAPMGPTPTPLPQNPAPNSPAPTPMSHPGAVIPGTPPAEQIPIPDQQVPMPRDAQTPKRPATSQLFRPYPGAARAWQAATVAR